MLPFFKRAENLGLQEQDLANLREANRLILEIDNCVLNGNNAGTVERLQPLISLLEKKDSEVNGIRLSRLWTDPKLTVQEIDEVFESLIKMPKSKKQYTAAYLPIIATTPFCYVFGYEEDAFSEEKEYAPWEVLVYNIDKYQKRVFEWIISQDKKQGAPSLIPLILSYYSNVDLEEVDEHGNQIDTSIHSIGNALALRCQSRKEMMQLLISLTSKKGKIDIRVYRVLYKQIMHFIVGEHYQAGDFPRLLYDQDIFETNSNEQEEAEAILYQLLLESSEEIAETLTKEHRARSIQSAYLQTRGIEEIVIHPTSESNSFEERGMIFTVDIKFLDESILTLYGQAPDLTRAISHNQQSIFYHFKATREITPMRVRAIALYAESLLLDISRGKRPGKTKDKRPQQPVEVSINHLVGFLLKDLGLSLPERADKHEQSGSLSLTYEIAAVKRLIEKSLGIKRDSPDDIMELLFNKYMSRYVSNAKDLIYLRTNAKIGGRELLEVMISEIEASRNAKASIQRFIIKDMHPLWRISALAALEVFANQTASSTKV